MTKARDLADIIDSNGIDITGSIEVGDGHTIGDDANDNLTLTSSTGENIKFDSAGGTTLFLENGSEVARISSGNVGIGTDSPDGNMHIFNSSAGTVTAPTDANELVLESSSNVGMSFLTANSGIARIKFGDPDATNAGVIAYNHSNDTLSFNASGSERMRIDSSGAVVDSEGGAATTSVQQGLCKQWINFSGGGAVNIRDSFNTTSITDNSTGNHTVTIANNMANSNWSVFLQADLNDSAGSIYTNNPDIFSSTSGSYGVGTYDNNNFANFFQIKSGLFGDLA